MIEIKSKLRRWGNSFGIVVPLNIVEKERVREGDEITVLFTKGDENVLKEMFGTFKFKKSVDKLMKEVDDELYGE